MREGTEGRMEGGRQRRREGDVTSNRQPMRVRRGGERGEREERGCVCSVTATLVRREEKVQSQFHEEEEEKAKTQVQIRTERPQETRSHRKELQ